MTPAAAPAQRCSPSALLAAVAFLTACALLQVADDALLDGALSMRAEAWVAGWAGVEAAGTAAAAARVWWCGWLTAASTALGVLPLLVLRGARGEERGGGDDGDAGRVAPRVLATSNAVAAGMMLSACGLLVFEGATHVHAGAPWGDGGGSAVEAIGVGSASGAAAAALRLATATAVGRVAIGAAAGVAFIVWSKRWLDAHGDVSVEALAAPADGDGADTPPAAVTSDGGGGGGDGDAPTAAASAAIDEGSSATSAPPAPTTAAPRRGGGLGPRALLIVAVMTLHSLSEGVGLGVSFGSDAVHGPPRGGHATGGATGTLAAAGEAGSGSAGAGEAGWAVRTDGVAAETGGGGVDARGRGGHGHEGGRPFFGAFISAALAVHNVPEGLAIALVLAPRGVPLPSIALWAVASSLPQPLCAVPAFLFVRLFLPVLPLGLGFAAGAMAYVAVFELLAEAAAGVGRARAAAVAAAAAAAMAVMQALMR